MLSGVNLSFLLVADGEYAAHCLPLVTRQIPENPIRCAVGWCGRRWGNSRRWRPLGKATGVVKKSRLFQTPVTEEISTLANRCSHKERFSVTSRGVVSPEMTKWAFTSSVWSVERHVGVGYWVVASHICEVSITALMKQGKKKKIS